MPILCTAIGPSTYENSFLELHTKPLLYRTTADKVKIGPHVHINERNTEFNPPFLTKKTSFFILFGQAKLQVITGFYWSVCINSEVLEVHYHVRHVKN